MELPTGVEVVYTHDGLRVAIDGPRRGLIPAWVLALGLVTLAWRALVGPDLSAMTLLLWSATMMGLTMAWPVAHSVVELHTHGVRVLGDGEWIRIPWSEIAEVALGEGQVIRIDWTDGRVVRIPAGGSLKAARWLVGRIDAMATEVRSARSQVPRSLQALRRSGPANQT